MRLPSPRQHIFSRTVGVQPQRSAFNRSFSVKTTFDVNYIVPFYVDEVLPGDSFNFNLTAFARLSTPIAPIMDNMYLETFFYFVPNRLVWDNFKKMMGEQDNPDDSTDYITPIMKAPEKGVATGSLSDHMRIPTLVPGLEFCSLWHRAYNLIYNRDFRDENLIDSVPVPKGDGPDNYEDFKLLKRGKRHDYFTSALPWPQKGEPVLLPLEGNAPVTGLGLWFERTNEHSGISSQKVNETSGAQLRYEECCSTNINGMLYGKLSQNTHNKYYRPDIYADLSQVTANTVDSLHRVIQMQRFQQIDARGGTRYEELVLSHFNVVSYNQSLAHPEYLGGGSTPVAIHPVVQTSASTQSQPQGSMGAFGTTVIKNHGFRKTFTEHGMILGLLNVRADLSYQYGLPRMYSRRTKFDYYWPSFAHLGEQAIYNKELYAQGPKAFHSDGSLVDDDVFGYQEHYAEYRYAPSQITGLFRSNCPQSLDLWHLAQDFSELPKLSKDFIEEDVPIKRVLAVSDEPHFIMDGYCSLKCARPMPVRSVPGALGRI